MASSNDRTVDLTGGGVEEGSAGGDKTRETVAQLSSHGFAAVMAYTPLFVGRRPSNMLPDSHASTYNTRPSYASASCFFCSACARLRSRHDLSKRRRYGRRGRC
uniref:Uncharacterized protein n=1 Tax=Leersia perrieri TaxID=77586 RepID=A0A0D9XPX6_9ORYZ